MSEQKQYRLLSPGEKTRSGDQFYVGQPSMWEDCGAGYTILNLHTPHRRPIEPAGWPEAQSFDSGWPDPSRPVLLFDLKSNLWLGFDGLGFEGSSRTNKKTYTHWLYMPPPPPVQPKPEPWREAWDEYLTKFNPLGIYDQPKALEQFRWIWEQGLAAQKGKG